MLKSVKSHSLISMNSKSNMEKTSKVTRTHVLVTGKKTPFQQAVLIRKAPYRVTFLKRNGRNRKEIFKTTFFYFLSAHT